MSAFDAVFKLITEWQPQELPRESGYRDSLTKLLRERLRDAKIETEYRHGGTTIDIYVKQAGFFGSSDVFVELKRNFLHKPQLDRLVGQVASLQPKKDAVIVALCGETNSALVTRLEEQFGLTGDPFVILETSPPLSVIVKKARPGSAKSS